MARTFTDSPAVRSQIPLLLGLSGPSGGGKTFSALRLAVGIQRVVGGDIYGIDTESNRMLHYADKFKFRHVPFGQPFDPLSYLAVIEYCQSKGAKTIIVDSMSHEHEGPGGVLEMHAKIVEERGEKFNMLAWAKPKQERRRLLNTMLQIPCNFILCFRAKEKVKVVPGKNPENRGFMPIAGEEFVFEMTANALLMPGAGGVPTWNPQESGEKIMTKLPEQFRELLMQPGPLDESKGEKMAQWAAGANPIDSYRKSIEDATTLDDLAKVWKKIPTNYQTQLTETKDSQKAAIQSVAKKHESNGNQSSITDDLDDEQTAALRREEQRERLAATK